MKTPFLPALLIAILFLAARQNLLAQGTMNSPSNSENNGGLYQTVFSQAILAAMTSDGQDVSSGLTVVVGQPIPTVSFSLAGSGLPPPGVERWDFELLGGGGVSIGAANMIPYYGIAPGLSISGATLSYTLSATLGHPTLPSDATLDNPSAVQLVGTPTQIGLFDVDVQVAAGSPPNTGQTPFFDYFIHVVAAPATTFTTQPASQSVAVGQSVTFTAAAAGSPTYQWSGPNGAIAGATGASLTLTDVQMSAAGAYSVTATVTGGSVTSSSVTLTVLPLSMPAFTLNPVAVTVASSHSAVFSVTASGEEPPTYQWSLNNAPLSGATDPVLEVPGATSANAGSYTCTASNSSGSVTSTAAILTVATTSNPGRLINLSARAAVGTGNNILIGGFAVGGTGTKQLLVRGTGPALSIYFNNDLATPQLVLLDNTGAIVATNIGWSTAAVAGSSTAAEAPVAASLTLQNALGAFAYAAGSADSAMVLTMPVGNNTAQLSGVGGTSGVAVCELYDADVGTPTARLVNISARADVGTGNSILIGGFAIGGGTAETVLIRAVGPGLNDLYPTLFPLSTILNQPVLSLLDSSGAMIYSNTVWGGDATIAAAFTTTGAFSLNPAHADSALLVTLPPGNYTAQVSGLNGGAGIALCEVYEVP